MEKTYNVNEMRPAFIRAREKGNSGVITVGMCKDLGVSEVFFNVYLDTVKKLFEAVADYCRKKNSPSASDEAKAEAYEKIFPLWKELLQSAEKDKFDRDLRVGEHDISNLVGFAQSFMKDKNDASRGADKTFIAQKVWAVEDLTSFRKKIETDLGIRIAGVEVLSDDERDHLREERKTLSKWKKAEGHKDDLSKRKEELNRIKAKLTGDEAKKVIDDQIADIDKKIVVLDGTIAECQKKYDAINAKPSEPESSGNTELTTAAD